jgi:hypothetical protein
MTQPTARTVGRRIAEQIRELGIDRATIAAAAGLNERKLRRRLSGETAFKAHELLSIEREMNRHAGEVTAA